MVTDNDKQQDPEKLRIEENNAIIDHVQAIQEIVEQKCARCNGGACMGCLFDRIDTRMIPECLDQILSLMAHLPNDRATVINGAILNKKKRHSPEEI